MKARKGGAMAKDQGALLIVLASRQLSGPLRRLTPLAAGARLGLSPTRVRTFCLRWLAWGWLVAPEGERAWAAGMLTPAGIRAAARVAKQHPELVRLGAAAPAAPSPKH